jgi:hypothetical protein
MANSGWDRRLREGRTAAGGCAKVQRQFGRFFDLAGLAPFALHGLAAQGFALALHGFALQGLALHGLSLAAQGLAAHGLALCAAALQGFALCAAAGAWASASPPATAIMAARLMVFIIVS